jgi:hypothetical protein
MLNFKAVLFARLFWLMSRKQMLDLSLQELAVYRVLGAEA